MKKAVEISNKRRSFTNESFVEGSILSAKFLRESCEVWGQSQYLGTTKSMSQDLGRYSPGERSSTTGNAGRK